MTSARQQEWWEQPGQKGLCKWRTSEANAAKGCRSQSPQEKPWTASWWREEAQQGGRERSGPRAQSKSVDKTRGGDPGTAELLRGVRLHPNCSWEPLPASLPFMQQGLERQAEAQRSMVCVAVALGLQVTPAEQLHTDPNLQGSPCPKPLSLIHTPSHPIPRMPKWPRHSLLQAFPCHQAPAR